MSVLVHNTTRRLGGSTGELAKLAAFCRRDLLTLLSYRAGFASDWLGLAVQILLLYFVAKLVDTRRLPTYGGELVTYLAFTAVGIALGMFVFIGLTRVSSAIRAEQMMGTLESLLVTPTSPVTIQLGSAAFDLIYIPIRTAVFLAVLVAFLGVHCTAGGIAPALVVLLAFAPVLWGLGLLSASAILTFRRGGGVVGIGATILTFAAGAYFPLTLLPSWLEQAANANPLAVALGSMRSSLLGDAGWSVVPYAVAVLIPAGVLALAAGLFAFQLALRREQRLGTLGLY
jgi:ABC-2 type transport system permease protein